MRRGLVSLVTRTVGHVGLPDGGGGFVSAVVVFGGSGVILYGFGRFSRKGLDWVVLKWFMPLPFFDKCI